MPTFPESSTSCLSLQSFGFRFFSQKIPAVVSGGSSLSTVLSVSVTVPSGFLILEMTFSLTVQPIAFLKRAFSTRISAIALLVFRVADMAGIFFFHSFRVEREMPMLCAMS